ncbi:MAG: DUF4024 domain-containing protein [Lachnospiraceae bacterium]|nr:DUF4024 domain-containing protein [Lachnospiraceae bacterium]
MKLFPKVNGKVAFLFCIGLMKKNSL